MFNSLMRSKYALTIVMGSISWFLVLITAVAMLLTSNDMGLFIMNVSAIAVFAALITVVGLFLDKTA